MWGRFWGLLAFQFADWLEQMEADQIQIVEAGHMMEPSPPTSCAGCHKTVRICFRVSNTSSPSLPRVAGNGSKKLQEFAEKSAVD